MLGRFLAVCLGGLAACYSPPRPDCGFICGPGGACPESYHCGNDNRCRLDGTAETPPCSIDAAIADTPSRDAAPPFDATPDADTMPFVVSTLPPDGAFNVPHAELITVVFNEPVTNVNTTTFSVVSNGVQSVTGTVTGYSPVYYEFDSAADFDANATITVTLGSAIIDTTGNMLSTTIFEFTVAP